MKLEYDNTRISVPESWDDITLGFYESFYDEEPSTARERVEWVAHICNVDSELLLEWPSEVFNRIVGYLDFLFKNNPAEPSPTIEVEGVKFIVPIEEELTLGAWVDIDEVQKQGKNVLSNILAIVCRPVGEKYDCKNNDERREMFAALPVSKVLGVLAFFFTLQRRLRSTYTDLFKPGPSLRPIAPEYRGFSLSWGWYKVIADLAGDDIQDLDRITALPVTKVFTYLLYRRDKEYAEEAQRKLDRSLSKNK